MVFRVREIVFCVAAGERPYVMNRFILLFPAANYFALNLLRREPAQGAAVRAVCFIITNQKQFAISANFADSFQDL